MNTVRRYAVVAAAVVLTLLVLGAGVAIRFPSSARVSSLSSSTSDVTLPTSSATSAASSTSTNTTKSSSSTTASTSTTSSSSSASTSTSTSALQTSTSSSSGPSGAVITIPYDVGNNESLNFQPSSVTVVLGVNNTVTWVDLDSIQHTVVSTSIPAGAQKFDSGILNQGQSFSWTFTVPGTYHYDCSIHPTWMKGTVVVLA